MQLSHSHMTTGKTIALTQWTFVSKIISLLFNMLSRFVTHSFSSKEQASFNFMAEIQRCLLLGRKAMTNLDSILKSREITLPTKVHLVKAMCFSVVMYGSLPWWLRWLSICLQCRRPGFNPWVGNIPWRRKWQPMPVLLPGEFHGEGSLVGFSPWGHRQSDTTDPAK